VIPFEQSAIGEDGGEVGQKGGGPSSASTAVTIRVPAIPPGLYPFEISARTRRSTTDTIEDG
jgi:hypothetical protein